MVRIKRYGKDTKECRSTVGLKEHSPVEIQIKKNVGSWTRQKQMWRLR